MKSHAGIASRMFECLAKEGINIRMISTSEIKTSVVIEDKYLELAVRALHKAFGLEGAPVEEGGGLIRTGRSPCQRGLSRLQWMLQARSGVSCCAVPVPLGGASLGWPAGVGHAFRHPATKKLAAA